MLIIVIWSDMFQLNLPRFDYKVKKIEGKLYIFDVIRKKYVVLLPEEWVRQHLVHFMISELKYPRSLIRVEGGLQYNGLAKRSDIVVHDRNGSPWMVAECKSPEIAIDESTIFQASTYNATLKAPYLVASNGLRHLIAHIDWENRRTEWLTQMPSM